MRQPFEFFGEIEFDLIYIAKRLNDAQRLENALTAAALDYLVEADEYRGGFIFQTVRTGAFFYIDPKDSEAARDLLVRNGFRPQPLES